jgi:hypothetical protein
MQGKDRSVPADGNNVMRLSIASEAERKNTRVNAGPLRSLNLKYENKINAEQKKDNICSMRTINSSLSELKPAIYMARLFCKTLPDTQSELLGMGVEAITTSIIFHSYFWKAIQSTADYL